MPLAQHKALLIIHGTRVLCNGPSHFIWHVPCGHMFTACPSKYCNTVSIAYQKNKYLSSATYWHINEESIFPNYRYILGCGS